MKLWDSNAHNISEGKESSNEKETKSITLATHKTLNSPPFDDHKMV